MGSPQRLQEEGARERPGPQVLLARDPGVLTPPRPGKEQEQEGASPGQLAAAPGRTRN